MTEFREMNPQRDEEYREVVLMLFDAFLAINNEALGGSVKTALLGKEMELPAAEARLWYYLKANHAVRVAIADGHVSGIMIYTWVFEHLAAVKILYVNPAHLGSDTGIGLVRSVEGIRKVIFQTNKKIPPEAFFKSIGGRPRQILESENLKTFEMDILR